MTAGSTVLGYKVRDIITGFEGVVTGYVTYLSGCNQVLVNPGLDQDGKTQEAHWLDEQRVAFLPGVDPVVLDNTKAPGFGQEAPKR